MVRSYFISKGTRLLLTLSALVWVGLGIGAGQAHARVLPLEGTVINAGVSLAPPFALIDTTSGNLLGIDVDLIRELQKRTGFILPNGGINVLSLRDLLTLTKKGDIDIAAGALSLAPERSNDYLFSAPTYRSRAVIVVKNESPILTIDNLHGKHVAAEQMSVYGDFLVKNSGVSVNLNTAATTFMSFYRVTRGISDAVVTDEAIATDHIRNYDKDMRIAFTLADSDYDMGLIFRKDSQVAKILQTAFAEMVLDGTVERIVSHYMPEYQMLSYYKDIAANQLEENGFDPAEYGYVKPQMVAKSQMTEADALAAAQSNDPRLLLDDEALALIDLNSAALEEKDAKYLISADQLESAHQNPEENFAAHGKDEMILMEDGSIVSLLDNNEPPVHSNLSINGVAVETAEPSKAAVAQNSVNANAPSNVSFGNAQSSTADKQDPAAPAQLTFTGKAKAPVESIKSNETVATNQGAGEQLANVPEQAQSAPTAPQMQAQGIVAQVAQENLAPANNDAAKAADALAQADTKAADAMSARVADAQVKAEPQADATALNKDAQLAANVQNAAQPGNAAYAADAALASNAQGTAANNAKAADKAPVQSEPSAKTDAVIAQAEVKADSSQNGQKADAADDNKADATVVELAVKTPEELEQEKATKELELAIGQISQATAQVMKDVLQELATADRSFDDSFYYDPRNAANLFYLEKTIRHLGNQVHGFIVNGIESDLACSRCNNLGAPAGYVSYYKQSFSNSQILRLDDETERFFPQDILRNAIMSSKRLTDGVQGSNNSAKDLNFLEQTISNLGNTAQKLIEQGEERADDSKANLALTSR